MSEEDFEEYLARYDQSIHENSEREFLELSPVPEVWKDRFEAAQQSIRALNQLWVSRASSTETDIVEEVVIPPVIDRFEIRGELGRGGFGIVYRAWDKILEREVALKVPRIDCTTDSQVRQRIYREGRLAASLTHPNIVPILEALPYGGYCCVVSALCEGGSLAMYLMSQGLTMMQNAELIACLSDALSYCHERGVVHLDIKPANIMLRESPSGGLPFTPQLADFGLAKPWSLTELSGSSSLFVGTPQYMAPEQVDRKCGSVGPATDIYSLGCVLYELIHSRPPFTGDSLIEVIDKVRNEIPSPRSSIAGPKRNDLDTICMKCLEKSIHDRYASAADLRNDVQSFIDGTPINAQPITLLQRWLRWCRNRQRFRDMGVIIVATNVVIVGTMTLINLMPSFGIIPTPQSELMIDPRVSAIFFMVLIHVPLVCTGFAITHERAWAVFVSLVTGLAMSAIFTANMLGFIPIGSQLWDDIPGFRVVYSALSMLIYLQTIASLIALLALKEKERQMLAR